MKRKHRILLYKVLSVLLVFCGFIAGEMLLRQFFAPPYDTDHDPLVAFYHLRPLFEYNEYANRYETAENRLNYFYPQSFSEDKPQNTFRIFCLGGSTVQGRPYAVPTSFPTWLQLNLKAVAPDTNWEMVNCGGISYASYRLIPILKEVLSYSPDLIILYTGHNEFLEDRSYESIKNIPYTVIRLHQFFLQFRVYSLPHFWLRDFQHRTTKKHYLPTEIDVKLDREIGMETYQRDPVWKQGTIKHFRLNLHTLLQECRNNNIPVILMNPVSNLRDIPPFKSEQSSNLSIEDQTTVEQLIIRANHFDDDINQKIQLYNRAAKLDPENADILYSLAVCYDKADKTQEAKRWYIQAKEEDICPLRMLEPMHDSVLESAEIFNIPLVDAKKLFESLSKDGIPGDDWLVDHVHPSFDGHKQMADALTEILQEMGAIQLPDNWKLIRDPIWHQHFDSLPEEFFEEGKQELQELLYWSRRKIFPVSNER